jgi:hypothetical protein
MIRPGRRRPSSNATPNSRRGLSSGRQSAGPRCARMVGASGGGGLGRSGLRTDSHDGGRLPQRRRRRRGTFSHRHTAVRARDRRSCDTREPPKSRARRNPAAATRQSTWRSSRSTGGERPCGPAPRAREAEAVRRPPKPPTRAHRSRPAGGRWWCGRVTMLVQERLTGLRSVVPRAPENVNVVNVVRHVRRPPLCGEPLPVQSRPVHLVSHRSSDCMRLRCF